MLNEKDWPALVNKWQNLKKKLESQFGDEMDLEAILFLIGIQELGQGNRKYTKDQKMDLMHIAICRLLSEWGFYELESTDQDGWPHWKKVAELPRISLKEQDILLKQSAVMYFEQMGFEF